MHPRKLRKSLALTGRLCDAGVRHKVNPLKGISPRLVGRCCVLQSSVLSSKWYLSPPHLPTHVTAPVPNHLGHFGGLSLKSLAHVDARGSR